MDRVFRRGNDPFTLFEVWLFPALFGSMAAIALGLRLFGLPELLGSFFGSWWWAALVIVASLFSHDRWAREIVIRDDRRVEIRTTWRSWSLASYELFGLVGPGVFRRYWILNFRRGHVLLPTYFEDLEQLQQELFRLNPNFTGPGGRIGD